MRITFFLIALLLLSADVKELTGRVVKVTDGDTITVLCDGNKQEKIRLDGIDAPEKKQDFSERSRQYLTSLVAGKTVVVKYSKRDGYKRVLGVVYIDGLNVNEAMVKEGLAWRYKYSRDVRLKMLEDRARKMRLNIWSVKNPVDPYDYRRLKRRN